MKKNPLFLLFLAVISLSGCSKTSDTPSESSTTSPETSEITISTTIPEENSTTDVSPTTETSTTDSRNDSLQSGDDTQEDFDTPHPNHFTYRFAPDSVGVRLAGGNYQVLNGDFEFVIDDNGEVDYDLADYNFDSVPDLIVPTAYGTANVLYSVYLWHPETACFEESPLSFLNPTVDESTQTVICRSEQSATVKIMEKYVAVDGKLEITLSARADFSALTLTQTDMKDENALAKPQTQKFDSSDALETAFMNLK